MKVDLQYRENDYYNTEDIFLCYHPSLMRYLLTKVSKKGDSWYCVEKLQYKCSSVRMINTNEIFGNEITLKGLDYSGKLVKALAPDNFGIVWKSGKQVKDNGLANFWQEWHKLDLEIG